MNNNPKVWVIQEGNNDYSSAESFGDVHFITKGDLRNMDCSQNEEVDHDITRFLAGYLIGTDYIISVGNPMLAAKVAMSLPKGNHQFLKWDGRRATYIPFLIKSLEDKNVNNPNLTSTTAFDDQLKTQRGQ